MQLRIVITFLMKLRFAYKQLGNIKILCAERKQIRIMIFMLSTILVNPWISVKVICYQNWQQNIICLSPATSYVEHVPCWSKLQERPKFYWSFLLLHCFCFWLVAGTVGRLSLIPTPIPACQSIHLFPSKLSNIQAFIYIRLNLDMFKYHLCP